MAVAETMRKIRAHWRAQLGCDVNALPRGVTVTVHAAALAAYSGPYAVMREDRCVVSAPVWIVDRAHDALAGRAAADVFDAHAIAVPFGDAVERVIGPAWIGYADAADVRAPDARDARLLTSDDVAALRALSAAAGETAWQHSGIDFDRAPIFGLFVHDVLAAACSYERRGEHVLHVGVVTHPAHRGRGYGRAVASAATAHGLAAGGLMQRQTLVANAPSLAIGSRWDTGSTAGRSRCGCGMMRTTSPPATLDSRRLAATPRPAAVPIPAGATAGRCPSPGPRRAAP